MKAYVGTRGLDGTITVTVDEDGKHRPLKHHVLHSPTGFEWGYGGSGPADLARSILIDLMRLDPDERCPICRGARAGCWACDSTGLDLPAALVQSFKWSRVATLPRTAGSAWRISAQEVREYVDTWRERKAARDA